MQTKKEVKTKNKFGTTEALGTMQTNNKKEIREYMLYMWSNFPFRLKSTHGAYVGKGKSRSFYEIRFKNTPPTVLQL